MTTEAALKDLPAGPSGLPVIGNLMQMQRHGMLGFYRQLWEDCGDFATASIGPMKFLMVTRPEHIQHVLVKNADKYIKGLSHDKLRVAIGNGILTLEGDVWSRQRKLMQPTFTPKGIKPFADIMIEEAQALIDRWNGQLPGKWQVDISQEMQRVTMKVISRSMFGLDMDRDFTQREPCPGRAARVHLVQLHGHHRHPAVRADPRQPAAEGCQGGAARVPDGDHP